MKYSTGHYLIEIDPAADDVHDVQRVGQHSQGKILWYVLGKVFGGGAGVDDDRILRDDQGSGFLTDPVFCFLVFDTFFFVGINLLAVGNGFIGGNVNGAAVKDLDRIQGRDLLKIPSDGHLRNLQAL